MQVIDVFRNVFGMFKFLLSYKRNKIELNFLYLRL